MDARKLRTFFSFAAVIALPLATSVHEIALAALLGVAAWEWVRGERWAAPWLGPAALVAAMWTIGALASGNAHEGLGHAWLLAPLVAVRADGDRRLPMAGVGAAGTAAAWSIAQAAAGGEGHAGLSHHLTLAYGLLPPFAVALSRGWWPAALLLGAGALASRSDAVPLALVATAVATRRPGLALVGGAAATLVGLWAFADPDELRQRAILWTGGLSVSPGAAGAGGFPAASAPIYDRLDPGFWFPNHAHDSAIQIAATLGPAGLVATACLVVTLFRTSQPGAVAGLVGVLIGGLTQDTLGDLEVARAAWVWVALLGPLAREAKGWQSAEPRGKLGVGTGMIVFACMGFAAAGTLDQAREARESGDYAGAAALLDALHPLIEPAEESRWQLERGLDEELQWRPDRAESYYRAAIDAGGEAGLEARFRLVVILDDLGRHPEAFQELDRLRRVHEVAAEFRPILDIERGVLEIHSGKQRRGVHHVEKALAKAAATRANDWMEGRGRYALVQAWTDEAETLEFQGREGQQKRNLARRVRLMKDAETEMYAVIKTEEPEWITASLLEMGRAYDDLATDLIVTTPPKRLSAEQAAIFREEVGRTAMNPRTKAYNCFDKGVEFAARMQFRSPAVEALQSERDRLAEVR